MLLLKALGIFTAVLVVGLVVFFGLIPLNTELPIVGNSFDWDDFDPDLHGEVVQFDHQLYYVLLDERHVEHFGNGPVKIGRFLKTEESTQILKQGYDTNFDIVAIRNGMRFKIIKSAWKRENVFQKMFTADSRYVVFEDENGVESTMSVISLTDSSKPKLAKFDDKGEYRNYALLKYFIGD